VLKNLEKTNFSFTFAIINLIYEQQNLEPIDLILPQKLKTIKANEKSI